MSRNETDEERQRVADIQKKFEELKQENAVIKERLIQEGKIRAGIHMTK